MKKIMLVVVGLVAMASITLADNHGEPITDDDDERPVTDDDDESPVTDDDDESPVTGDDDESPSTESEDESINDDVDESPSNDNDEELIIDDKRILRRLKHQLLKMRPRLPDDMSEFLSRERLGPLFPKPTDGVRRKRSAHGDFPLTDVDHPCDQSPYDCPHRLMELRRSFYRSEEELCFLPFFWSFQRVTYAVCTCETCRTPHNDDGEDSHGECVPDNFQRRVVLAACIHTEDDRHTPRWRWVALYLPQQCRCSDLPTFPWLPPNEPETVPDK